MADTNIEWADKVWNPITGCTKISEGCAHCYAKLMANRLRGRFGYDRANPFKVTLHPDKLLHPDFGSKPCRVFVGSMTDLFHLAITDQERLSIWRTMRDHPQHTFMVLTKRPEAAEIFYMRCEEEGGADLPNLWLGVTAENQARWNERVPVLLRIPAAKRFVSVEPMLGPVCSGRFPDWVICGAETGAGARVMDPAWALNLRRECSSSGVPFFFKKWSKRYPGIQTMPREFPK